MLVSIKILLPQFESFRGSDYYAVQSPRLLNINVQLFLFSHQCPASVCRSHEQLRKSILRTNSSTREDHLTESVYFQHIIYVYFTCISLNRDERDQDNVALKGTLQSVHQTESYSRRQRKPKKYKLTCFTHMNHYSEQLNTISYLPKNDLETQTLPLQDPWEADVVFPTLVLIYQPALKQKVS